MSTYRLLKISSAGLTTRFLMKNLLISPGSVCSEYILIVMGASKLPWQGTYTRSSLSGNSLTNAPTAPLDWSNTSFTSSFNVSESFDSLSALNFVQGTLIASFWWAAKIVKAWIFRFAKALISRSLAFSCDNLTTCFWFSRSKDVLSDVEVPELTRRRLLIDLSEYACGRSLSAWMMFVLRLMMMWVMQV